MINIKSNNILFLVFLLLLLYVIYKLYIRQENFIDLLTPQSQSSLKNIPIVLNNLNKTTTLNNLNVMNDFYFTSFTGIIVAWSGEIINIPPGWGLCDGSIYKDISNNPIQSPDLRSKFILGASKPNTQTNAKYGQPIGPNYQPINSSGWLTPRQVGSQGGDEIHQLSIPEMPSHTHTYQNILTTSDNVSGPIGSGNDANNKTENSGTIGSNIPHNNMPPYYALAYIIKL
jgi:microcystin-dependent protein